MKTYPVEGVYCENNTRIIEKLRYNFANEDLSFSSHIEGCNGKKLVRLN